MLSVSSFLLVLFSQFTHYYLFEVAEKVASKICNSHQSFQGIVVSSV